MCEELFEYYLSYVKYLSFPDIVGSTRAENLATAISELSIEEGAACVNTNQVTADLSKETVLSEKSVYSPQQEQETSKSYVDHMISDARVAILFSGGIDSAMIAALADRYMMPLLYKYVSLTFTTTLWRDSSDD